MSTSAIENLSISEKLSDIQTTKTAIREAIVAKGVDMPDGTTFRQYSNKIDDIIGVPDLSNPGAADDLRSGKQLVGADGSIVTGNLPEVTQATPTISVSSGGLITASATQSGGIVEGGTKSTTQQLTTEEMQIVTPGTESISIGAAGSYMLGEIYILGDENLVPENIAEGVSIFGVQGTHSGGGTFQTCAGTMPVSGFIPVFVFLNADGELEAHSGGGSSDASQRIVVGSIINFGTTVNVSGGLVNIDNRRYRVTGNFTARPSGGPP